jgi:RNA polymerase sigma-70 factor (ECF subfamily)
MELAIELPHREVEQQAFVEIYREHYATVFNIAQRILGATEEAEEIAQETFIKLYQRWPNLTINISLRSWLARVAINLSISRYRRYRRSRELNKQLSSRANEVSESTEEKVVARQEAALVAKALGKLRKRDRTCLIARYAGLSYQEVADIVGARPSSIGKILQRAEASLKKTYLELERKR